MSTQTVLLELRAAIQTANTYYVDLSNRISQLATTHSLSSSVGALTREITRLASATSIDQLSHQVSAILQVASDFTTSRSFFSNLTDAVHATNTLLSNTPAGEYQVQVESLPLEELYGLVNALHANSIAWHKHTEALLNTTLSRVDTLNSDLGELRQHHADSRASIQLDLQNLLSRFSVTSDRLATLSNHCSTNANHAVEIKELLTKHTQILAQLLDLIAQRGESSATTPTTPVKTLPDYQAEHAPHYCRSYGVVVGPSQTYRIPMDFSGRHRSTTLKFHYSITRQPDHTSAELSLNDDSLTLFATTERVEFELRKLPGDALHLLRQICPRFLYKLEGCC